MPMDKGDMLNALAGAFGPKPPANEAEDEGRGACPHCGQPMNEDKHPGIGEGAQNAGPTLGKRIGYPGS